MEIALEPEMYAPGMDETNQYIDRIPCSILIKQGIRCPCGSRKDKSFTSNQGFIQHIKTKTHQRWLADLNLDRANHYVENIHLKDAMANQRLIIAKMEKDLHYRTKMVTFLTLQLQCHHPDLALTTNLLDFD